MFIHIKVKPNSKKEVFKKIDDNHFEISVKEKAERNLANKRVLELLKKYITENIKKDVKQIRIVNGHHSPSKLVSINLNDLN